MTTQKPQGASSLGISHALYPFGAHYHEIAADVRMHYIDEGQGDPVVMVHGNPSWSFYYRNLVNALSPTHRTIVPDHIGCGLSDKPDDAHYNYTLSQRVEDLESLLESLGIRENITLIVHDWGGMIGMTYATHYPERIKRLVIMNTAAFHLPSAKSFPLPLRLARDSSVGSLLISHFNAFSRSAAKVCVSEPMPPEVAHAYTAPYNSPENRIATLRFVQDIPLQPSDRAYALVSETEQKLPTLAHLPILICWGGKDFVFDRHFLARWREIYPLAKVVEFDEAGHYVLEDRAEEIEALVKEFLG
ncbi:MAG: alpha/beta fold hydrolase [Bradymonadaceae bacterium]|nr:alpha/beta fold hydrolase [Lujinxingiaceae bacterium]